MASTPIVEEGSTFILRRTIILAFLAVSALAFISCTVHEEPRDVVEPDAPSSAAQDGELSTVVIPARWNASAANDRSGLLRSTDLMFIGRVTRLTGQYNGLPDLPDKGASTREPSFPVSLFDVSVEDPWTVGLLEGDQLTIKQAGGFASLSSGTRSLLILEGDERLDVGEQYLFLITTPEAPDGSYTTVPFMRFKVAQDGRLVPLSRWEHLEGLRELTGKTSAEAKRLLGVAAR